MGSTTCSTSAAITSPPASIEPPEPKPSRPGPRSPAWPLGHKPSWDRPSCALSRPEPIKLTVPHWGSGRSASADGTQWDLHPQSLMSEYHIRYGGYGGIGYYLVSDTYPDRM